MKFNQSMGDNADSIESKNSHTFGKHLVIEEHKSS